MICAEIRNDSFRNEADQEFQQDFCPKENVLAAAAAALGVSPAGPHGHGAERFSRRGVFFLLSPEFYRERGNAMTFEKYK